jgi:DNA-binding transcriptional regulator GbsR (MarR family)
MLTHVANFPHIQNILNVVAVTRAQTAFIEDMGQLMAGWGIARNTGRIYAYLLLQREPSGLDDIVDALGVAKSGASVAARQLTQLGLARSFGQPGSRRVLYEALYTIDSIITARDAQLRALFVRLRQGARAARAGQARQQLEALADWCEAFANEMPLLLQRLERRRSR